MKENLDQMLFSSMTFLVGFLPLTLLAYYYWPGLRGRNRLLLFASLLFYAWGEPVYVLLMIASILFNYRAGLLIAAARAGTARKALLAAAAAVNLLALVYFKYLGFALRLARLGLAGAGAAAAPALPIGISFYTFQSISYLVDVYRSAGPVNGSGPALTKNLVQRSLADLGLYIAFFPQLIAGPIVRYHDVAARIAARRHSVDQFAAGAERFITGLAKKTLLANPLAEIADGIFAAAAAPPLYAWLAVAAYALQIYYDFSGYSDMAIGLGKLFGFEFLENFDHPYAAVSVTDFWRRWHISLSRWFRDYVYIPLGGNRRGRLRTALNLYLVFFITGLWHGAELNFVAWGLGHGTLMFLERIFGRRLAAALGGGPVKRGLGRVYTLFSVALLWVFFRLDLGTGAAFTAALFGAGTAAAAGPDLTMLVDTRAVVCLALGVVFAFPWWRRVRLLPAPGLPGPRRDAALRVARYGLLLCCLALSMSALASDAYNPFIYFRF